MLRRSQTSRGRSNGSSRSASYSGAVVVMSGHSEPENELSAKFKAPTEALRSASFARELELLRTLAFADHPLTTGRLARYDLGELQTLLERSRSAGLLRPRAWRDTSADANDGLRHVHDYLARCRRVSRRYLHHEAGAALVHEAARYGMGVLDHTTREVSFPEATGPRASSLAADLTGASWGAGATSLAEARRQWVRPRAEQYDAAYAATVRLTFRYLRRL
jgi:hypothetical protein